jgi:hypothetical protein
MLFFRVGIEFCYEKNIPLTNIYIYMRMFIASILRARKKNNYLKKNSYSFK